MKIKYEEISLDILKEKKVRLFMKRIDKINCSISGNKYYKLKYNLIEAKKMEAKTILTFGGAYSNHIAATAYAAQKNGFKSIGIIRGEECLPLNPTLTFASKNGMTFNYVNRNEYRLKTNLNFLDKLKVKFKDFYLIPEGGTNHLAIKGTAEILDSNDNQDYICCAVGTGGTIAGIINSINNNQEVIGFPAIRNFDLVQSDINKWTIKKNWNLLKNYKSSRYGHLDESLVNFINMFHKTQKIPLDAVYNGKMMLSIINLVENNYFRKGSDILAINTGGLQGNAGFNEKLGLHLPISY